MHYIIKFHHVNHFSLCGSRKHKLSRIVSMPPAYKIIRRQPAISNKMFRNLLCRFLEINCGLLIPLCDGIHPHQSLGVPYASTIPHSLGTLFGLHYFHRRAICEQIAHTFAILTYTHTHTHTHTTSARLIHLLPK